MTIIRNEEFHVLEELYIYGIDEKGKEKFKKLLNELNNRKQSYTVDVDINDESKTDENKKFILLNNIEELQKRISVLKTMIKYEEEKLITLDNKYTTIEELEEQRKKEQSEKFRKEMEEGLMDKEELKRQTQLLLEKYNLV